MLCSMSSKLFYIIDLKTGNQEYALVEDYFIQHYSQEHHPEAESYNTHILTYTNTLVHKYYIIIF